METDRVVTYHHPGQELRVRNLLFDPGIGILEGATAVHGISTEMARSEGVPTVEGIAAIIELLRTCAHMPLVGFNLSYDLTLLDREARRYGLPVFEPATVIEPATVLEPATVIDGFVVDKQLAPRRPGKRTLNAISELYAVTLDNAHTADADALASTEREHGQRHQDEYGVGLTAVVAAHPRAGR